MGGDEGDEQKRRRGPGCRDAPEVGLEGGPCPWVVTTSVLEMTMIF